MLWGMLTYCFLCHQDVTPAGKGGHPLDPCTVTVVTNADRAGDEHQVQVFFCHFRCIERVVGDLMYLEAHEEEDEGSGV